MILVLILCSFTCFSQNIGIGTTSPNQKLSINGKIEIGDDNVTPQQGTIRFNSSSLDFEGWTGNEWKSLSFTNNDIAKGYTNPNGEFGDNLGYTVDIDFDFAAAGEPNRNRVKMFARFDEYWGYNYEISNLQLENNGIHDQFGKDVGIGGLNGNKFLIVGAPGYYGLGNNSGGVGVYRIIDKTSYLYGSTIVPGDNAEGDYFGEIVSVFLNDIAISAIYKDDSYSNEGSVYIYEYNANTGGVSFIQKISSPNPEINGQFGKEILLADSNNLFVYTPHETINNINNVGRVYHFVKNSNGFFVLNQIIDNPTPSFNTQFGRSLAYFNGTLMIGASDYNSTLGVSHGAVYVFPKNPVTNTFYNAQKLTVSPTSNNDDFGHDIAMYNNKMVVSAPGYDAKGKDAGAIFYFEKDGVTWSKIKMLHVSDEHPGGYIGHSLATYNFVNFDFIMGSNVFKLSGAVHFLKAK